MDRGSRVVSARRLGRRCWLVWVCGESVVGVGGCWGVMGRGMLLG